MIDFWHTEITQDGDRWSFVNTLNGIWHSSMRNYPTEAAAAKAADWHKVPMSDRPSLQDELTQLGL